MSDLEAAVKEILQNQAQDFAKFINSNMEFIAKNSFIGENIQEKWEHLYQKVLTDLNIPVKYGRKLPDWGAVALRVFALANSAASAQHDVTSSSAQPHVTSSSVRSDIAASSAQPGVISSSAQASDSSSTSLIVKITAQDKTDIATTLRCLDEDLFWKIVKQKEQQQENNENDGQQSQPKVLVVDQKVIDFATRCNYHYPSQSLILDIGDNNWEDIFTESELDDIEEFGDPMFPPIPTCMSEILNDISQLNTPLEAYQYARSLEHDPLKEPLKAWLAIELQRAASFFFYNGDVFDPKMLESDLFYEVWGFIRNVTRGTKITTNGSEGVSVSNGNAINNKRAISAIEPAIRRKIGHKIDTIYYGNRKEVGIVEVGKKLDQKKEMKDGMIKMPIVMHDMLINLAVDKTILRKVKVLGYAINGCKISMVIMDSPGGYVSRIRRSVSLEYPSCSDDFIKRIVSLFKLALTGLTIMLQTSDALVSASQEIQSQRASRNWELPKTFIPSSTQKKSSLSSSSALSPKRQKISARSSTSSTLSTSSKPNTH